MHNKIKFIHKQVIFFSTSPSTLLLHPHFSLGLGVAMFSKQRSVEMWRNTCRNQRNRQVHLNRQEVSAQSTTGSRGVRISGSNAGYTTFRGSVKSTGYPLHLPVSPSLPLPCITVCHHISTGIYHTAVMLLIWAGYQYCTLPKKITLLLIFLQ